MTNRADPRIVTRDGDARTGAARGARGPRLISFAEYLAVRNVPRAGYPHVAYGYDVRAEGDVAFDLEPVAAAQRRRPGGKPLLEVGQQLVIVLIQRDDGLLAVEAGPHLARHW